MKTVTMHVAKTTLSKLVAAAEAGEEVVILRGRTPVARLVGIGTAPTRSFGALAGSVQVTPAFFDPLPASELDAWES
ncbi:type II toxin-antitoxin system Phd/YefM family antitoxin [Pseudogemmatithrix spongiicola]|uniref:Antitoxin n=1 Tax=Pseudogemmatithrix spongiicola TaxID=3062599 RepID=A0AA49JVH6_9BACT|nr:type II toxin-antitoxin system Phd/YefM family antitoxin [Gemmatimonadaceae bacterium 'strain 138']WKW15560.1 type II toxin-antitoxin system Phd/YefM family antitoxin [Gemmatimonadaceae bacterium 'strain 318']